MPSMAKPPIWLPNPPMSAATTGTRMRATSADVIRKRIRTSSATIVQTPSSVSIEEARHSAFGIQHSESSAQVCGNLTRVGAALGCHGQDLRGGGCGNGAIGVFAQQES